MILLNIFALIMNKTDKELPLKDTQTNTNKNCITNFYIKYVYKFKMEYNFLLHFILESLSRMNKK